MASPFRFAGSPNRMLCERHSPSSHWIDSNSRPFTRSPSPLSIARSDLPSRVRLPRRAKSLDNTKAQKHWYALDVWLDNFSVAIRNAPPDCAETKHWLLQSVCLVYDLMEQNRHDFASWLQRFHPGLLLVVAGDSSMPHWDTISINARFDRATREARYRGASAAYSDIDNYFQITYLPELGISGGELADKHGRLSLDWAAFCALNKTLCQPVLDILLMHQLSPHLDGAHTNKLEAALPVVVRNSWALLAFAKVWVKKHLAGGVPGGVNVVPTRKSILEMLFVLMSALYAGGCVRDWVVVQESIAKNTKDNKMQRIEAFLYMPNSSIEEILLAGNCLLLLYSPRRLSEALCAKMSWFVAVVRDHSMLASKDPHRLMLVMRGLALLDTLGA